MMAYPRSHDYRAPAHILDEIDPGLRAYMLRVYSFMAGALAVSGVTGYAAVSTGFYRQIAGTPLIWVVMLAPLALIFFISFRVERMSLAAAQLAFWSYAILMGLSLSGIFLVYTDVSLARTFFITAGTFGAMSLYGYTTGRDLTRFGSFLFMGLVGIILAILVNLFLASAALEFAISLIGVALFIGLTAYDTQRIRNIYVEGLGQSLLKKALIGALTLYLDFINLFLMLLRFNGERRD